MLVDFLYLPICGGCLYFNDNENLVNFTEVQNPSPTSIHSDITMRLDLIHQTYVKNLIEIN